MRSEALNRVTPDHAGSAPDGLTRADAPARDAMNGTAPTGSTVFRLSTPTGLALAARGSRPSPRIPSSLLVHLVDLVERDICSQPNEDSRCIASLRINRVRHRINRVRRGSRSLGRRKTPNLAYRSLTRGRASSRASDLYRSDWLSHVCGANPASLSPTAVLPGPVVATVATAPLGAFSALLFGCDNRRMFGSECQSGRVVRSGRSVGVGRGWSENSEILGPGVPYTPVMFPRVMC